MPRSDAAQCRAIDATSPGPLAHGSENIQINRCLQCRRPLLRLHHVKHQPRVRRGFRVVLHSIDLQVVPCCGQVNAIGEKIFHPWAGAPSLASSSRHTTALRTRVFTPSQSECVMFANTGKPRIPTYNSAAQ